MSACCVKTLIWSLDMNAGIFISLPPPLCPLFWLAFNAVFWTVVCVLNGWFQGETECSTEVSNVLLMMKLNETFLRQVAKYCVSRLDKGGGQLEWWAKCGSPLPDHVTAQVAWEWPPVHGMAKGCKPQNRRAGRNCTIPKWFSLLSGTSFSLLGQPMPWHCVDNSRLAGDMPSS